MLIQAELKVPKGQTNSFGGYKYRSCEDIIEAAKPICAKHKCLITLSDTIVSVGEHNYVEAEAVLRDAEEGNSLAISVKASAREANTKKGMDDAQITGSASSYARKYALNGLLAIDDTKDADATNDHGKVRGTNIDYPPPASEDELEELAF